MSALAHRTLSSSQGAEEGAGGTRGREPGSAVSGRGRELGRPSELNARADGATPAPAAPLCGQWGHRRKRRGPGAIQGQREGALGAKAAWSGEQGILWLPRVSRDVQGHSLKRARQPGGLAGSEQTELTSLPRRGPWPVAGRQRPRLDRT